MFAQRLKRGTWMVKHNGVWHCVLAPTGIDALIKVTGGVK